MTANRNLHLIEGGEDYGHLTHNEFALLAKKNVAYLCGEYLVDCPFTVTETENDTSGERCPYLHLTERFHARCHGDRGELTNALAAILGRTVLT